MKYKVGSLVVLKNGKTVYVTGYDEKEKKYKGFDTNETASKEEAFSEEDVVMTI